MSNVTQGRSINNILIQEVDTLTTLLSLLQKESTSLSENNLEAVASIADNKKKILSTLELLERKRISSFSSQGKQANQHEFEEYIDQHNEDTQGQLANNWQQVESLGVQCQRQNLINGNVIECNRQATEQILSLLRGSENGDLTYGPSGRTIQPQILTNTRSQA
ncbi:MAG: hypothetical protein BMS9Abin36_0510 [Gammaproteobacteria bacterium]|nr:MAG: hypothetical protein BMS9Abin36_0510 [Gammaproteobacteria bacterium]